MSIQAWTAIIIGASFALSMGVAIYARARTTSAYYVADRQAGAGGPRRGVHHRHLAGHRGAGGDLHVRADQRVGADLDGVIEFPRSIDGVRMALLFRPIAQGRMFTESEERGGRPDRLDAAPAHEHRGV